jgi:hypothetical protein
MRRTGPSTFLLVALMLALLPPTAAGAETLQSSTVETRVSVFVEAPEAAVKKRLPPGWELGTYAQGPYKGANLVAVFFEYLYAADPAGKPLPPVARRQLVLAVPVKNPNSTKPTVMVVGGWGSDPDSAPGPYKKNTLAVEFRRAQSAQGSGVAFGAAEDAWFVDGGAAGTVDLRLRFTRSMATRLAPFELHVYSAAEPSFYRIYRVDYGAEMVRSVPANVDRAQEARLTVKGPAFADLFDGSEKVIGIVNTPWYVRQVFLPQ